ncbi:MAG TPA: methylated-DNA--[protein]-cysteine S-methyltransferase [Hellea balneolensis]|uniref:Methylated-DNA--protein-cysteine methyltransferase n=1 Tax=Hellea balneolensis TaxID=287478 RepID=A0A7V5U0T5_9PROT|nr:methylated-DNA--[protein]-cysteine S-methyltransferase [Hellea balneolensis]
MRDGQKISPAIDRHDYVRTPIGVLLLAGCGRYLRLVGFPKGSHRRTPLAHWRQDKRAFVEAKAQLLEYFNGQRKGFDLPIRADGTEFQRQAWTALQDIPYGQTRTYGQQAAAMGNPKACRAVGGANHANPIPIIIPCHRVIGAGGALTGFGGGLAVKDYLLRLEGAIPT